MDADRCPGGQPSAHEYCELNDFQLRAAIRLMERRLRRSDEDYRELQDAYRAELGAMRRQLATRFLRRIVAQSGPVSPDRRDQLRRRFEQRAMSWREIARSVRSVSRGRAERLDALTEIEAMALLLRLEHGL